MPQVGSVSCDFCFLHGPCGKRRIRSAALVKVGSALVDKILVAEGKWGELAKRAAQYVATVKEARAAH